MSSPYDINNLSAYQRWREQKLEQAPAQASDLIVEVNDPLKLSGSEHAALLALCRRSNMVIYAARQHSADKNIARKVGSQFGLENLDANWLAGEDGISEIKVSSASDPSRQAYIPYTNKPIKWHTDGYYNTTEHRIRGMLLHCVHSAAAGGENRLMDHEMVYMQMRDENPEFIRALSAPDVMTIPARTDDDGVARAAQSGPVFSVDGQGKLHMRYTARTRSIEWKQDELSRAAVAFLEQLLASDSPYIYQARLESGMGLLCNNVLHDRSAFNDNPDSPRLLYRARYYDRIAGS
ncbi:MAG: taurine catabolism dioxygenase TauD [Gallionellales bacterium 35-53-114]|jgi:alpha-ketoglutarate-dependent taurine dioxygenase|nr:MAG: taurine catabolism dioxygenase TauD [Gallionellales bacterium 35-53-114]OYZ64487.1 MAG: taurine catabolism dioxygenase TauD [Gallionellales bacterium 24-53-125]OZB10207.1 MAG: taurine catabolism dioxygenase TauD [Gallionellales bacterium 39-52-133]HQS56796.1 TauD/TfdA family dioxygenase [Gallionellaceae bacterium]HQS75420.1 TauD/TfdA family dioxygenase [Gallionellaceae bacterium]